MIDKGVVKMSSSVTQKERIVSLDIIRGIALLGILFINVGAYKVVVEGSAVPVFSELDRMVTTFIDVFIEKKFFSIFSFLFGVGFYIFASRAESRGDKPRWRFARRLLALLVIGIIHLIFFWGSILFVYAVIGFFLLPFYRAKATTISKWLFSLITVHIVSILGQLFLPNQAILSMIFDFVGNDPMTIYIMFLSGLLVAKVDWVGNVKQHTKQIKWVLYVTCPLFIGMSSWIWFASQNQNQYQKLQLILGLGVIPTTYFYLACLFLLLQHKWLVKILTPIGRVGQMAFTNYLAQNFIGLAIISLMGIEVLTASQIVTIAVIIYGIQIICSVIWFKFFKMGPLEQLWRWMTYGRKSMTK